MGNVPHRIDPESRALRSDRCPSQLCRPPLDPGSATTSGLTKDADKKTTTDCKMPNRPVARDPARRDPTPKTPRRFGITLGDAPRKLPRRARVKESRRSAFSEAERRRQLRGQTPVLLERPSETVDPRPARTVSCARTFSAINAAIGMADVAAGDGALQTCSCLLYTSRCV